MNYLMINYLLSMIMCLNENSPKIGFYESAIRDFSSLMGYDIQLDGSPLSYKDIGRFLEICKENDIKDIGIRTDKLEHKDIELIKKYNVRSVMFHMQSRSRNGSKIKSINSLNNFKNEIQLARNESIPVEISMVIARDNLEELDKIIEWCESNGVSLLVIERNVISRYRNYKLDNISSNDYKSLMFKIKDYNHSNGHKLGVAVSHCPNKILLHKNEMHDNNLGGCSAGIISCTIDVDGEVIPCLPLFDIRLGNIQNDSIANIWRNSPVFALLRDRNNLQGQCGRCKYKYCCGGCRAESYIMGAGLIGEDITCWEK